MNILIVSATTLEIKSLLQYFTFSSRMDSTINRYKYKNMTIDVLTTGVGMVPAAYFLGRALNAYSYDAAFNFGIAGSFNSKLSIGTVVNVNNDQFPELGAENGEYFLSLVDLKLLEEDSFPFKNGQIINENPIKSSTVESLPAVRGITVNRVHGNNQSIKKIRERCNPDTESMEGAAFLYACKQEGIPCSQIRAISNFVEERNTDKWNIPYAIENLNKIIIKILNES
ncbi:MAG: futalosine hydrolase [Bacteroidales bacterium]